MLKQRRISYCIFSTMIEHFMRTSWNLWPPFEHHSGLEGAFSNKQYGVNLCLSQLGDSSVLHNPQPIIQRCSKYLYDHPHLLDQVLDVEYSITIYHNDNNHL